MGTVEMENTKQEKYTLKEMREISRRTATSVAELIGTSYKSIWNWETGAAIPNIVNINDLLKIYEFSFHDLDLTPFYEELNKRSIKQEECSE